MSDKTPSIWVIWLYLDIKNPNVETLGDFLKDSMNDHRKIYDTNRIKKKVWITITISMTMRISVSVDDSSTVTRCEVSSSS